MIQGLGAADRPPRSLPCTKGRGTGAPRDLLDGDLARRLRDRPRRPVRLGRPEPGEGDIAIGGATLAAQAACLDLIDEYHVRWCPVLVGGGTPFFAHLGRQVDLELVETRVFDSGVVAHRHRVKR